jgi:hypothetical protein
MGKVEKDEPLVLRDGTVLTEEVAEEFAKEAEEGYDLSKARWRPVGRPSLSREGVSPRINLRMPFELYEDVRRKSLEDGVSMSELARVAIRQYVGE